MSLDQHTSLQTGASGFCGACNREHYLALGASKTYAIQLIDRLNHSKNIAFPKADTPQPKACTSTLPLWGEARGKMFGILECYTKENTAVLLYGFSGQFNGQWCVEGWVPPLFDLDSFHGIHDHREKEIKTLTRKIEKTQPHSQQWRTLRKIRKDKSRKLMRDIHSLYRLTNFNGETKTLEEVFNGKNNIPTGTGDCCAPKLLGFAAKNNLHPTGICEFFYGKETKSGSHVHGEFSSPCLDKCAPILGFMLCGVDSFK